MFYGYWDPRFLGLLFFSTSVDYWVAKKLESNSAPGIRRGLLYIGVSSNLLILGIFKYYDFFAASATTLIAALGLHVQPILLDVVLPVGISFYSFQSMAYTIDVYRGKVQACPDFPLFCLFVSYFPQLVAGPVERAGSLLPQLSKPNELTFRLVSSGLELVVLGLFKKTVIGDTAGYYLADPAFKSLDSGVFLWVGTFAFAIQIYGDFSGYCDIARGVSRMLGVELTENFRAPYFASTITDFWRRWHITLSSWFRDYLYIPLGGNRGTALQTYRNLSVTMVLCGLWHGAGLHFLLWGAYHGFLLLLHRSFAPRKIRESGRLEKAFLVPACFLLVCYGWMLFRLGEEQSIMGATALMFNAFTERPDPELLKSWSATLAVLGSTTWFLHWIQAQEKELCELFKPLVHGLLLGGMMTTILLFGSLSEPLPFIYFQF